MVRHSNTMQVKQRHNADVISGCPTNSNSVAPFKERIDLVSSLGTVATCQAEGLQAGSTTHKPRKQQSLLQPVSSNHSQIYRRSQSHQPVAAARAVTNVAVAEAAVSSATAALVRGKHATPHHATGSRCTTIMPGKQQQQQGVKVQTIDLIASQLPVDADGLQVHGVHTGPTRVEKLSAPCTTMSIPQEAGSIKPGCFKTAAGQFPSPPQPAAAASQPRHQLATQAEQQQHNMAPELMQVLVSSNTLSHVPAAAQLAAQGLSKRLRAQLRSAHGPPAFQRAPPPPRPPSPPPVVLDVGMIMACSPDVGAPGEVVAADLSSFNITSITAAAPEHHQQTAEPYPHVVATLQPGGACQAAESPLPSAHALSSLSGLVALDLSDNRLQTFADLAALPSLAQLNVSANRLRDLGHLHSMQQQQVGVECSAVQEQHTADGQEPSHMQHCADECDQVQLEVVMAGSLTHPQGSPQCCMQPAAPVFGSLEILDVSYNLLPAGQLLGPESPLGMLPRLRELHAAGNTINAPPAQLAPFTSLTLLNLQHNHLQLVHLEVFAHLPVLQHLDVSHNPLGGSLPRCGDMAQQGGAPPCGSFDSLQVLNISSSRVKRMQAVQQLLSRMRSLILLQMTHTPLAERCKSGKLHLQSLQRPGLSIVSRAAELSFQSACCPAPWRTKAASRWLTKVTKIPESIHSSKVLAAASRAALASVSHEQLVAAFDRIDVDLERWQQLPPVLEEDDSGSWATSVDWTTSEGKQRVCDAAPATLGQKTHEDIFEEDRTFLTGVGITGELHKEMTGPDASSRHGPGTDQVPVPWQDPTERLAISLGLKVSQLAHVTGHTPGNPDGALHRLRHALARPLVDPNAGQRPQRHYMSSTAAAAAKQQPSKLVQLPHPISTALRTRVEPLQDLGDVLKEMQSRLTVVQGSLLPQLHAHARSMSGSGAL